MTPTTPTQPESGQAPGQGRYVHVYMEANPNPASLKFVANHFLAPEGVDFEFADPGQAQGVSPLAERLFGLPFIERVFIRANFVTLTKGAEYDWAEVGKQAREEIQRYLEQGLPVLSPEALSRLRTEPSLAGVAEAGNLAADGDSPVVIRVKEILDEYIRPAVEGDGGAINFHSFEPESGLVRVELRGSCSGCPSSTVTLKAGIENLLRRMVPEVREVVAEGV